MRIGGAKKRRDSTEAEIVATLRQVGATVFQLSGAGVPDLLVGFRHRWYPLEVKGKRGKPTALQSQHPVPIVRTPEQAFAAIGLEILSISSVKEHV
jgi:Holliday junction resolvase